MKIQHLMFAAALALTACGKKSENPPATGSAAPIATGSADPGSGSGTGSGSATGSAESAAAVDIPTEVDFEAEATTTVTEKNLKDQVKTLETSLSGT